MKKIAAGLVMMLSSMQLVMAQKPTIVTNEEQGWQKIGETTVSFKEEDESIVVIGADEFSALKLKVTDAPIKIERLQVFYESGDMQELKVDSELQPGAETEGYSLDHKDRDIQKVAFTYRTLANDQGDKAHVELHGLKTDVNEPSDAYRAKENVEQAADSVGDDVRDAANNVGDEVDSVRSETREAAENIKNEMDTAAENTSNYMNRKAEEADSAVNRAGEEINDAAENVEDDVEDGAARMKNDVNEGADSVGDDVSEAASNTASHISDDVAKDKEGPEGQKIYVDKQTKYYYINDEGKKVFIGKEQLKNKKID